MRFLLAYCAAKYMSVGFDEILYCNENPQQKLLFRVSAAGQQLCQFRLPKIATIRPVFINKFICGTSQSLGDIE